VAQLRLTVFLKTQGVIPVEDWWQAAVGEPPENTQQNRTKGINSAVGQIENTQLAVVQVPGRVDWTWEPLPNPLDNQESIPGLGIYDVVVSQFRGVLGKWVPGCPESTRVAFGARLMLPMPDRLTAYSELGKYLNFDIEGEDTSDFLYQINRRRNIRVGSKDVVVNRLCKWSSGAILISRFQLLAGSQTLPTTNLYFVNLQIDINSAPEFSGIFLYQDILPTLDQFAGLGAEIAREGDI
jgi:hypothetical protein